MPLDGGHGRHAAPRAGKRPLILVGPQLHDGPAARRCGARRPSGVPVIGMESPRGIADPSLGAFAEMLAQADCVLLVGKRLDFTLKFGSARRVPAGAQVHQVDAEPPRSSAAGARLGERLRITAIADAASALRALKLAARDRHRVDVARRGARRDRLSARGVEQPASQRARSSASGADAAPAAGAARQPADSVLVCDGGEIGQWARACLKAPHRVINGVAGSIGSGLPYALAARCAAAPTRRSSR